MILRNVQQDSFFSGSFGRIWRTLLSVFNRKLKEVIKSSLVINSESHCNN